MCTTDAHPLNCPSRHHKDSRHVVIDVSGAVLDKAESFAACKKIDPSVLVSWRLDPDMFALARQVQIVADQAKSGCARLAGVEAPRFEHNENTIEELKARLEKTVAFLKTVDANKMDASAVVAGT